MGKKDKQAWNNRNGEFLEKSLDYEKNSNSKFQRWNE